MAYVLGPVGAAAAAVGTSTLWLDLGPAWITGMVGATAGLVGVSVSENAGDGIIFMAVVTLLAVGFALLASGLGTVKLFGIPLLLGIGMGKLIGGFANEFSASAASDAEGQHPRNS